RINLTIGWSLISLIAGLSLFHFGSSGEFFYFPAIFIFAVWQILRRREGFNGFKNVIEFRSILFSLLAIVFTASPLILFDFLKGHILSQNIKTFLFEKESFKADFATVFSERMNFYYTVFTSKIFHWIRLREKVLLEIVAAGFILRLPKIF